MPDRSTIPSGYERVYAARQRAAALLGTDDLVVRFSADRIEVSPQGTEFFYLSPTVTPDQALPDWTVALREVRKPSGRHTHQGGMILFVLEGEGYSIIDGDRFDWKAGDAVLMPFRRGGIEHQHFNLAPDKPAIWIAFISEWARQHVGSELVQGDTSQDWKNTHSYDGKIGAADE
jgi:hypothetical protein